MAATFKNFATTKLTQNLSASATTANVSSVDAAKLPIADGVDSWFYLVIQRATDSSYFEVVKVTNNVDGVLTIVREQEGTIAKAFLLNDLAEARLTTMGLLDAFVGKSDWRLWAVTEAQFESERAGNRRRFAASGYESFGKHYVDAATLPNVNQGLFVNTGAQNTLFLGRSKLTNDSAGVSKSYWPIVHVAGVLFEVALLANVNSNLVKFPQAPDGKTTYNKATGVNIVHASFSAAFSAQAADPTNVEVVINRVDGWLNEVWAEEVSLANPYVYPLGLPQSIAATMDGIATSDSNRPDTYYSFYVGDSSSKGKGLNFFALTDAQKKKVLANHKNNLVLLNDGRLVQWRLRIRTFAGAGNGDWRNASTVISDALVFSEKSRVRAQGMLDANLAYTDAASLDYVGSITGVMLRPDVGTFGVRSSNQTVAINGECYALFGGTVKRLNQGAYHPSFNPSGASQLTAYGGMNAALWHASNQPLVSQTAQCFNYGYGYPVSGGSVTTPTVFVTTGGIGGYSGRPDGRYYDAIHADGDGGVCRDMRYSAYGKTLVDFAEADQRVKNTTYRGFEKPSFSRFHQNAFIGYFSVENNNHAFVSNGPDASGGGVDFYGSTWGLMAGLIAYQPATGLVAYGTISDTNGAIRVSRLSTNKGVQYSHVQGTLGSSTSLPWYFLDSRDLNYSIGGSFLQTDVIGSPANILATPQLANGWQGSWLPQIPDGADRYFTLTRKSLALQMGQVYTSSNGAVWDKINTTMDTINSTWRNSLSANFIVLNTYQAFAKQTENAMNAEVYGGAKGVGEVAFVRIHEPSMGGLLQEATIGKINTDNTARITSSKVFSLCISGETEAIEKHPAYAPKHFEQMFALVSPNNNSSSVKLLSYNVNLNQQAFIQYAYTELKHNGTNWGDDDKVTIVDNQSSKTDLNGNTVLIGTAKLKEPIGWIKNNV